MKASRKMLRAQAKALSRLASASGVAPGTPVDEDAIFAQLCALDGEERPPQSNVVSVDELMDWYARQGQDAPDWVVSEYIRQRREQR